jgi:AcrR family transcriptional regulator
MTEHRPYKMTARAESSAASRERIARAGLKLWLEQAFEDVTLTAIASAAGVSHQTVLNHFASKEGVAVAAMDILSQETTSARDAAQPGDVAQAVRVLVSEYEKMGDANARWAMSSERLGSLAPLLDAGRANHRAWLERQFAEALPTERSTRRRAVDALHAATDVYAWKLLRRDLARTRAETEQTLIDLVNGILSGYTEPTRRATRRKR